MYAFHVIQKVAFIDSILDQEWIAEYKRTLELLEDRLLILNMKLENIEKDTKALTSGRVI